MKVQAGSQRLKKIKKDTSRLKNSGLFKMLQEGFKKFKNIQEGTIIRLINFQKYLRRFNRLHNGPWMLK